MFRMITCFCKTQYKYPKEEDKKLAIAADIVISGLAALVGIAVILLSGMRLVVLFTANLCIIAIVAIDRFARRLWFWLNYKEDALVLPAKRKELLSQVVYGTVEIGLYFLLVIRKPFFVWCDQEEIIDIVRSQSIPFFIYMVIILVAYGCIYSLPAFLQIKDGKGEILHG